jgi:hypothetical protein
MTLKHHPRKRNCSIRIRRNRKERGGGEEIRSREKIVEWRKERKRWRRSRRKGKL